MPAQLQGTGVAAQVALARRESPVRGGRLLGLATALVGEMPHTLRALAAGRLSEWRATLLVRETAHLPVQDRRSVDRLLVADPTGLEGLGDRALVAAARKLALRLDPQAVTDRARRAEGDRSVTCRPAPDTMAYLTALLPVREAVAAQAALMRSAESARASGDPRSRGQVMADTLVERLTGQAVASAVPVEVQLAMTDRALLQGDDEPARLPGYGPVAAGLGRHWLRVGTDGDVGGPQAASMWIRRLFTHPTTGELVAMESRRRVFPEALRRFLVARDQTCRTPWCDAPIRHADHVVPNAAGGATSAENGQGLCEQCNYTKQAPGWRTSPVPRARAGPPGRQTVEVVTPTRHRYRSRAPAAPGVDHVPGESHLEFFFRDLVLIG